MTDARYFDSRSAIAAASDLDFGRRRKSRQPLPNPDELRAQRQQAVGAGFHFVKGKTGVTVFRYGGSYGY